MCKNEHPLPSAQNIYDRWETEAQYNHRTSNDDPRESSEASWVLQGDCLQRLGTQLSPLSGLQNFDSSWNSWPSRVVSLMSIWSWSREWDIWKIRNVEHGIIRSSLDTDINHGPLWSFCVWVTAAPPRRSQSPSHFPKERVLCMLFGNKKDFVSCLVFFFRKRTVLGDESWNCSPA